MTGCEIAVSIYTVATPFGGCGGGGYGAGNATAAFRGLAGSVRLIGGYDSDPYACQAFEYLTGVPEACVDARTLTPEQIRAMWGEEAPWSIISSPPCLPAHGPVLTPDGARRIDSLRPGDLVLTHRGRYRPVVKVGCSPYDGTMFGIRLSGGVDVQEFTAEHPIYVRRYWRPLRDGRQRKEIGDPQFMLASKVRVGDFVGFPIDQEAPGTARQFVESFGDVGVATCGGRGGLRSDGRLNPCKHTRRHDRFKDLTAWSNHVALWFLIGAYLGDGYVRESRNEVIFAVGARDGEFAGQVRQALGGIGLSSWETADDGPSNIKIHVGSKHLCVIVKSFGVDCYTKKIPTALFGLERACVGAMIEGYRAADGSDSHARRPTSAPRWSIHSASLDLLRGVQRLLLRLGIFGAINIDAHARTETILGRSVQTRDRWAIAVQEQRLRTTSSIFIDGYVWVRVRSIAQRAASETVWNLEVDEDNTFCAPMMATHNCVGATALISHAKANTDHYVEMNGLMLPSTRAILEAYGPDPRRLPAFFVFENVPGLGSDKRGGKMLKALCALLTAYGYVIHRGHHNARHIGGGAQNRVRLLIIARNVTRAPVFLYKPPHLDGLVVGDVIGPLPLPDDPRGGPMHRTTRRMSFLNRLRLWAIEAGKDWRSLRDQRDGRGVDLLPQADNPNLHENKYVVVPWNGTAKAVTTATRVGSGAQSVAQPVDMVPGKEPFRGAYGVVSALGPAGAVIGNARPSTGPYSVAAPVPVDLVPAKDCFDAGYGVLAKGQPSRAIASTSAVGCGAYAVADDVPREPIQLELGCEPHAGAYGVQRFDDAGRTVLAQGSIDNTAAAVADPRETPRYVILACEQVERIVSGEIPIPFAILDPAHPDEPLAIVDDLRKPAFRIVRSISKRGRVTERREPVTVVLISKDGTWHRELTTLELAALQDFPWMHKGAPLDFGGGTTEQRGIVGNAIPCKVMEAVFRQILISSMASAQSFFLSPSDWSVWVQGLRDDGYEVIDAGHRPLDFGGGFVLDDGATIQRPVKKKTKGKRRPPMRRTTTHRSAPAASMH